MKTPFILVEDADVDPGLATAVQHVNSEWDLKLHKITNATDYTNTIATLSNAPSGDLVAAFDLDYSTAAGAVTDTPYWNAIEAVSRAAIPPQTKHGVNALFCLLNHFNQGNCLIVVSSNFTGDTMDSGRALKSEIQKLARNKRPAATIHAYFPGGPLTVANALLIDRLQGIKNAFDAFFGSMASRLRPSQNAGWFKEGGGSPAHMIHADPSSDLNNENIKSELSRWLACVSGAEPDAVRTSLDSLFIGNGFGFYKHSVERVTGACALHCGRANGKALNMHGLALIACCYAGDFANVFKGIIWLPEDSERLIEPAVDTEASEELLYLFVGKPTDQVAAQASGVFGILGVHDGRNYGVMGSKTVMSVELTANSVKIKFGIKGDSLAEKFNNGGATGTAYSAIAALRQELLKNGVAMFCEGTDSDFILTIAKP